MKKLLAMLLCVVMLSGMCTAFANGPLVIAPNPFAKTVHVRVESVEGNIFSGTMPWTEGATALSVVEDALRAVQMEFRTSDSPYGGQYIYSIGAYSEAMYGGYEGWVYFVDGESPMYAIDGCVLEPGQTVLVAFGDMNLVLPVVTATRDYKGMVTLTVEADVTHYDENWNMSIVREPMADVKLTVDGGEYVTDQQGKAILSAQDSAKDSVSVQLEKLAETGAPLLVRLEPDFKMELASLEKTLPFADIAEGQWYTDSVLQMAELGVVNGMPDGTFQPGGTVTRAQVANMLYKLAGQPAPQSDAVFSDVKADGWYASAVRWAYEQGIVTGSEGKFRPDDAVTRQDLAVMLVRYQDKVVQTALPEKAEAPAFADNDQIAPYAAEAVYLLQKAGIVTGTDGKFQPAATATRGQLCKMLAGLVVSD